MSNSKMLTHSEVGEIEAQQVDRRKSLAFHQSEYPNLPTPSYIEEIDALCATVRQLLSERLEVQRALASSVLNDPTEDDDPPYSTTELVNGIHDLITRKESLLTRVVAQKTELKRLLAENEKLKSLAAEALREIPQTRDTQATRVRVNRELEQLK